MAKKNRAERRQDKFGGSTSADRGGWPASQPNPAFGQPTKPDEATTGRPDQGETAETGPGTGGATQQDGRAPRHEGVHPSNSTKG